MIKNILKKRVPTYVTIVIFIIAYLCIKAINNYIFNHYFLPHTYIKEINVKTYNKELLKIYLDEFNKLGNNKIIRYNEDVRPITITDDTINPNLLGLAEIEDTRCNIKLNFGIDEVSLKYILYHEYLHCFGIMHIKDNKDLMNPIFYALPSLDNLLKYTKKLEDIYGQ